MLDWIGCGNQLIQFYNLGLVVDHLGLSSADQVRLELVSADTLGLVVCAYLSGPGIRCLPSSSPPYACAEFPGCQIGRSVVALLSTLRGRVFFLPISLVQVETFYSTLTG